MDLVKPITVEIERELWEQFKAVTTKDKTLNDAVVELIKFRVKEAKPSLDDPAESTQQSNDSANINVSFPNLGVKK